MISSMNAMVMPMTIRQPVATHGASTPVPSAGPLAGGTWANPAGSATGSAVTVALAVPETAAAPGPADDPVPAAAAPTPTSTGPADATRATVRL